MRAWRAQGRTRKADLPGAGAASVAAVAAGGASGGSALPAARAANSGPSSVGGSARTAAAWAQQGRIRWQLGQKNRRGNIAGPPQEKACTPRLLRPVPRCRAALRGTHRSSRQAACARVGGLLRRRSGRVGVMAALPAALVAAALALAAALRRARRRHAAAQRRGVQARRLRLSGAQLRGHLRKVAPRLVSSALRRIAAASRTQRRHTCAHMVPSSLGRSGLTR